MYFGYGVFVVDAQDTGISMLGSFGYGIIKGYHGLIHCASVLIIDDYMLIECACTG